MGIKYGNVWSSPAQSVMHKQSVDVSCHLIVNKNKCLPWGFNQSGKQIGIRMRRLSCRGVSLLQRVFNSHKYCSWIRNQEILLRGRDNGSWNMKKDWRSWGVWGQDILTQRMKKRRQAAGLTGERKWLRWPHTCIHSFTGYIIHHFQQPHLLHHNGFSSKISQLKPPTTWSQPPVFHYMMYCIGPSTCSSLASLATGTRFSFNPSPSSSSCLSSSLPLSPS